MNTLQDLRSTLDAHAAEITDSATTTRVAAVAGRARVVRRRRAAGVAVAAVLVAGAVAVPFLTSDSRPMPADRELIGKIAPATLESLGYTYHFAEGVEGGEKHAEIRLRASDEPRLITWASTKPEVGVLGAYDDLHLRSRDTDFDDFILVPEGVSGSWSVRAEGAPAAIAVYELGDERPEGVTVDGITFRDDVAGDRLLAAQIGEVGQDEVEVEVTVPPSGQIRFTSLCQGEPRDVWLHLDFGPRYGEFGHGPSCDDPGFDPGGGGGSTSRLGRPGEVFVVSAFLTRGEDGPRIDSDDVRLGIAAYHVAEPAARVAGYDVPSLVEHGGHVWEYDGQYSARPGSSRLAHTNSDDTPLLVQAIAHRTGDQRVVMSWNEARDGQHNSIGGGVTTFPLMPGERASIAVKEPVPAQALLGFAFYGRFD
jgi:hypothetical protein